MNFLVVGADGLIGRSLVEYLELKGHEVIGTTRRRETISAKRIFLDLTHDVSAWRLPRAMSVAYLCATMSKQNECHQDPILSSRINVTHTVALGRYLVGEGVFLVVPSTNLVFDGTVPFRNADDPVCPVTEYGRQKAETDQQLLQLGTQVSVVRFSKVIGPNMPLIRGWIEALKHGEVIHPISNFSVAPVALSLAIELLYQVGEKRVPRKFQLSSSRDVTYAEIAKHLAQRLDANPNLVQPITYQEAELDLEAVPAHTTLDMSRVRAELGIEPGNVWSVIDALFSL